MDKNLEEKLLLSQHPENEEDHELCQLRRKCFALLTSSLAPETCHHQRQTAASTPAPTSTAASASMSASASTSPSAAAVSSQSSSWEDIWLQAQAACAAQRLEHSCWATLMTPSGSCPQQVASTRSGPDPRPGPGPGPGPEAAVAPASAAAASSSLGLASGPLPAFGLPPLSSAALRAYRAKMRFLSTNFKRLRGSECHRQLLEGSVNAKEVLQWPEEVFLSSERRQELERSRQEALRSSIISSAASFGLFSELLECPNCAHVGANYALPTFTGHWSMKHETGKAVLARCPSCQHQWQQQEGF